MYRRKRFLRGIEPAERVGGGRTVNADGGAVIGKSPRDAAPDAAPNA
jgi:hypothetical protein